MIYIIIIAIVFILAMVGVMLYGLYLHGQDIENYELSVLNRKASECNRNKGEE